MTPTTPRSLSRRQAGLALTALATLSVTGCALLGEDGGTSDGGEASASPTGGDGEASDGGGQARTAGPVDSVREVDPGEALATTSYPMPSTSIGGTMTVGLHHLRVSGRTTELLLSFTPEFEGGEPHTLLGLHNDSYPLVMPALYDRENLKRYDILMKPDGYVFKPEHVWSTPVNETELLSRQTQGYWATFAAPEDDVTTMTVALGAGITFEDVTLEGGA